MLQNANINFNYSPPQIMQIFLVHNFVLCLTNCVHINIRKYKHLQVGAGLQAVRKSWKGREVPFEFFLQMKLHQNDLRCLSMKLTTFYTFEINSQKCLLFSITLVKNFSCNRQKTFFI